MNKTIFREIFIRTIPIMTGYFVLGMGFGVLLQSSGFSWMWALLMSLTMYSGTMQYVGVDLLASGASIISTAIMAFMLNARYMFYGISMIDKYKGAGWKKPYLIFGLTDENFALLIASQPPEGCSDTTYALTISILDQIYWALGCVFGAALGMIIPFDTTGIEFVMTALFVTVFVDQWRDMKNHIPALIGVFGSLIMLLIFGKEDFLIPAMVLIALSLMIGRRYIDAK